MGTLTLKGPGWRVATLASGGSSCGRVRLGAGDGDARRDHHGQVLLEAVGEHGRPRLDAEDLEARAALGVAEGQVDGLRDALEGLAEERAEVVGEVGELALDLLLDLAEHVGHGVGELHQPAGGLDLDLQRLELGHVLRGDHRLGGDVEVERDVEARDRHVGVRVDVQLERDAPAVEAHRARPCASR